ncbi:CU044_5270 family protein [Nocardiopsis flavescens]
MKDTAFHDDVTAVRRLLAGHDPAAAHPGSVAVRELARIEVIASGSGRGGPGPAPRRRLLRPALIGVAAALTAVAVVVPVSLQSGRPAHAGPPPAPLDVPVAERTGGRERLLALADAADSAEPPARAGDVAYVRTSEWTFTYSQNADDGRAGWGIVPEERSVWRTPRESGVELAVPGEPEHLGGDEGPLAFLFGDGTERFEWGDGEGGDGMFFTWEPDALSTDPAELEEQLVAGAGHDAGTPEATLFYALESLYTEAPVDPRVQASVLRVLAGHEGVLYAGPSEDRHGREGELFLVEERAGETLERRIMFDADTGMPLYHEIVMVESDYEQPDGVEPPVVYHYAVIADTAWVAEVEDRP